MYYPTLAEAEKGAQAKTKKVLVPGKKKGKGGRVKKVLGKHQQTTSSPDPEKAKGETYALFFFQNIEFIS
jgi:hypothetical protein